jgi:hypothetical protein
MDGRSPGGRRALATLFVALLAFPAMSGCLGVGREPLIVAASAPKAASGMTLFLATDGVLDKWRDESAEYAIYYGERLIYPPGGKGASFEVKDRTGTAFVPYNQFVVGNGEYDVVVKYAKEETRVRINVQKWAEYVFLHPFDRGSTIQVDVAISSATGGNPSDRILTEGDLIVEIHYRGLNGEEDRTIGSVRTTTRNDRTSTTVEVPRSRLAAGPGWYSFEPVFHNGEARNNLQVGADPTMANRNPPWNWIFIRS